MADARTAILITLDAGHEGGYQCDPNDDGNWSGGKVGAGQLVGTNGGITSQDMPGADIKNLTIESKIAYYTEHYWKALYSQITSQLLANKLFDMGVVAGVSTSVRMLQQAMGIHDDGNFGPMTLQHVNQLGDSLLSLFKVRMLIHYDRVVAAQPHDAPYLKGWQRRVNL